MSFAFVTDVFAGPTMARLLGVFVGASLKGSILLLLAWMLCRMLRGKPASLRHLVWASALGGMLLMPVLGVLVPRIGVTLSPRFEPPSMAPVVRSLVGGERDGSRSDLRGATRLTPVHAEARVPEAKSIGSGSPAFEWSDASRYFSLVWVAFAALVLGRLVLGIIRISSWTRRARPVDDGTWLSLAQRLASRLDITRPVTLLRSERACVPMTWGFVYPIVLLPIDADEWSSDRRAVVLLHELAHVKRLDAFTQIVAQIAVAVFWFNPIVWLAARQMRIEREHACDDVVLAGGARPTDYAQDLLQIARSLGGSSAPAAAALAMARRSEFEGRLLAILDPHVHRYGVSKARVAVAAATVLALSLPLAALTPKRAVAASLSQTPLPSASASASPSASASTLVSTPSPAVEARKTSDVGATARLRVLPPSIGDLPAPAFAGPLAKQLIDRLGSAAAVVLRPDALRAHQPAPDRETLIAVVRAAAKMTSDYDKAELLITVANHYIRDDELRTAYLDAAGSMTSSYDQSRVLLPMMLKDDLPPHAIAQVVKMASRMSSDYDKATLLVRTISDHESLTPAIRDAMIASAATIGSDYDRRRTVAAIVGRGGLSNQQLIDLIGVIKPMTSSNDKASALIELATHYDLADKQLRAAFVQAAETITSAHDYRRVIAGMLK